MAAQFFIYFVTGFCNIQGIRCIVKIKPTALFIIYLSIFIILNLKEWKLYRQEIVDNRVHLYIDIKYRKGQNLTKNNSKYRGIFEFNDFKGNFELL